MESGCCAFDLVGKPPKLTSKESLPDRPTGPAPAGERAPPIVSPLVPLLFPCSVRFDSEGLLPLAAGMVKPRLGQRGNAVFLVPRPTVEWVSSTNSLWRGRH